MMDKESLYEELKEYCSGQIYPFHMPGHKRQLRPCRDLPYGWDVTEVPGTDDLHEAEGILKRAMERTARVWGAERTYYLVNGSTCGLLAGIRALAPRGSRIIAARNCHKSVCHAVELGDLQVRWLMPTMLPEGICGPVDPESLRLALEETPDAACVILTSPTYEGVISDIWACSDLCHDRGIPLLVDEAHGAHLGFFPGWPESALHQGADLVVQSVHKTLPSLTQTALLHLSKGSLADPREVERQLDIFETSSPSYPLMVSIDSCTAQIEKDGPEMFEAWRQRLVQFDLRIAFLGKLKVLGHSESCPFSFDPGKLPICTTGTNLTGPEVAEILLRDYGLQTEMSQGDICLAMTGPGDNSRAMVVLALALKDIDRQAAFRHRQAPVCLPKPGPCRKPLAQALEEPWQQIPMDRSTGRICAEAVWAYPPGIPLILPGEEVTEDFLCSARALEASGTRLRHSRCQGNGIAVL